MSLSIHKCGDCVGCDLERQVMKCVAQIDEFVEPKLKAAADRITAARDWRHWDRRDAKREWDNLLTWRGFAIDELFKRFGWPSCVRLVITSEIVPA